MATVERVRRLGTTHSYARIATLALPDKCPTLHHHSSTIIPPKQEYGFTPHGGPNLGKTASVISVVLLHARLLFVQHNVCWRYALEEIMYDDISYVFIVLGHYQ